MVVGIHTSPGGVLHDALRPLFDVAVPIFFCITGYFLGLAPEEDLYARVKKSLLKLLPILLITFGVYYIYGFLQSEEDLSWSLIKYYIYHLHRGAPPAGMHLWYLSALLGGLLLFLLVARWRGGARRLAYLGLVLEALTFFCPEVVTSDIVPRDEYLRSVLFASLPNLSIGYLFAQGNWWRRIFTSAPLSLSLSSIAIVLTWSFRGAGLGYLGIDLLVVIFFMYALLYPDFGRGSTLETIGAKYSQGIYYWHLLFCYSLASPEITIQGWTNELLLILCILLSLLCSYLVDRIQSLMGLPLKYRI